MSYYYETPPSSQSSSTTIKIIGIIVILMIVMSTGLALLLQNGFPLDTILGDGDPYVMEEGDVKVGVIDSGLDVDYSIRDRVAEQKSFVSPQYGYDMTDSTTTDSDPSDGAGGTVPHGTIVARTVLDNSDNAVIVNAKVISPEGTATSAGISAAIYWAIEMNCTVINLSVGSSPTLGDPLEEAVEYAFSQGVLVVAAAGNDGQNGLAGNSINSPSVFIHTLSVAALDEYGQPAGFSSQGPTASRYMKPDITAQGYSILGNYQYFGTSFSSPRVAAAAADIISYCDLNDIVSTPGLVMTALMMGAEPMQYPEYQVGAGKLDLQGALDVINAAPNQENDIPEVAYVFPGTLPVQFEKLFFNDVYEFNLRMVNSFYTDYSVDIVTSTPEVFDVAESVVVNQTELVPLIINVPSSGAANYQATIEFDSGTFQSSITISFDATIADARIAFDITHTSWSIDTTYGQFKELYIELVTNDISVTEIRNTSLITFDYLNSFDAVFILDPCTWDINESKGPDFEVISTPYTAEETLAYEEYFNNGGGIFVAALSNDSLDIDSVNDFLSWTGFSLGYDAIPSPDSTVEITNLASHPITTPIDSFDFLGARVFHNSSAIALGRYVGTTVLASFEGNGGGRFVISGSNFFIDNWGMTNNYDSNDNAALALNIALWLANLL